MRFIFYFLFLFSISSVLNGQTANRKVKIVFRFDDYMLTRHVIFDSILDIFKKNNISLTLGVVPFDKDDIMFNKLSQDQLNDLKDQIKRNEIEIALHGYNHTNNMLPGGSLLKKKYSSEFSGMEYDEQVKKIKNGKEVLDSMLGINTIVFIPPYNSYDSNTIKALESLNFEVISASINGHSGQGKISYIPYTISDLTKLPGLLMKDPHDDYSIIAVIHPYSFKSGIKTELATPIYFSKLDTLLNWINRQENILTLSFSALAKSEKFDALRFKVNSTDKNMLVKIMEKLRIFSFGVYNTTEYQRTNKRILGLFNVVFHVIAFITFYLAAVMIRKLFKPNRMVKITFLLVFLLLILAVIYKAINSYALTIYVLFLTTIVVAFCTGLFRRRFRVLL